MGFWTWLTHVQSSRSLQLESPAVWQLGLHCWCVFGWQTSWRGVLLLALYQFRPYHPPMPPVSLRIHGLLDQGSLRNACWVGRQEHTPASSRGCSSVVEHLLAKERVESSNLFIRFLFIFLSFRQRVHHRTFVRTSHVDLPPCGRCRCLELWLPWCLK